MSVKDCLKLTDKLDVEDTANLNKQLKRLMDAGIPTSDAYTQAAELVMEDVLTERNELAKDIGKKKGFLQEVDIENLLNPASFKASEKVKKVTAKNLTEEIEDEVVEETPLDLPPDDIDGGPDWVEKGAFMRTGESRVDMNHKDVLKRVPELQAAAKKVQSGDMTAKEYDDLVNKHKLISPYKTVPAPATTDEMTGALHSNKVEKVGKGKNIPDGQAVGLRLDIPAYRDHDVWVPTVHEGRPGQGKSPIAHEATAVMDNPTFPEDKHSLKVAAGKSKAPSAVIKGSWKNQTEAETIAEAKAAIKDPAWVQVGFDPERHSYFYDRATTEPVVSGSKVIQIGGMVLVKDPVHGSKADFVFLRKEKEKAEAALDQKKQTRKVKSWVKPLQKRMGDRVPVTILDTPADADFDIPADAAGYYHDGRVYLIASNIKNEAMARQALEHEAIGHLGLEGALGRKKFNELIGDINNIQVEMIMDESAHPVIRKLVAELKATYVDEDGNYALNDREEAREILAHIAHNKPRLGFLREIYNKISAWVGEWAAKMGLADPDLAMIESMMVRATHYVRSTGQSYTQADAKGVSVRTDAPMDEAPSTEKPALMRRRQDEDFDKMSDADKELYTKLGIGKSGATSLWAKISNLKSKDIKEAAKTATARGYEGLFDGMIETKRHEESAGVGMGKETTYIDKKGIVQKTVDYANSAYVSMRLATGVSDMMTHLLNYGSLQWNNGIVVGVENTRGFLDVLGDLGAGNVNDWLVWMAGNRGAELMAQNREHNLSPEDIALAQTKNIGNETLFTRIKDEYNAMNNLQLEFAEKAGLINPEKRKEWESEWYVPFYRQGEDEFTSGPRSKKGFSHQSAGIKRLTGGEADTNDLLENLLSNWIKLTDASVKNNALRQMVDNFKDTETQELGYIQNETLAYTKAIVPKSQIAKFVKMDRDFAMKVAEYMGMDGTAADLEIINEMNKLDKEGFEGLWAITAPTDPDIVRIQRDGKNEYWRIKTPGLLRAVGALNGDQTSNSGGMRAARAFKRLLTTGVTASPDFMLRNFIRDATHSWAINKDGMRFTADSLKGLQHARTEGPIHRAMMAAGASFQGGYVHGTDPEATAHILRRELEKSGLSKSSIDEYVGKIISTPGKLESVLKQGWQHYRDAGDKIENASRVATAIAGREAGKPDAQWLFESKDLMDYSRRGNFGMLVMMTDMLPFFNARLQGLDKLGRAAATGDQVKLIPYAPGKWITTNKVLAKRVAMIGAFSIGLAMLNDDDDRYKELQDWEKDAYWHFFLPDEWPMGGHWVIPKPFELGFVAGTIPERMYRTWVSETQPSEKLKWSLMHGTLETLNVNPIPQFILPVAEIVANRSFYFDRPVESMSDKKMESFERYNQYTSETAIAAGDTALAKWLEISPKQLQHLWNGYLGTMGTYALTMADMFTRAAGGYPSKESVTPGDIPLLGAVYKGSRKSTSQWQVDFYDRLQEVTELHGTLQKYRTEGNKVKYKEYRDKHAKKLRVRKLLIKVQKSFSVLKKRRERILRDPKLTRSEKYEQSQVIVSRISALAKKVEGRTREAFTD